MGTPEYFDIAYDSESECFVYCVYDKDGKMCTYHILDDKVSMQLSKYEDISVDLKEAQSAINQLVKLELKTDLDGVDIIKKALFDYAIVLIVKCFNDSRDGRKLSLDYKRIFNNNDELKELYCKVDSIRNNGIAHSGDYMNALVLYFDPDSNNIVDLKYSHIKRLTGRQIISYEDLTALVEHIQNEVSSMKEKAYLRLVDELRRNDFSYYRSLAKNIDPSTIVTTVRIGKTLVSKSHIED